MNPESIINKLKEHEWTMVHKKDHTEIYMDNIFICDTWEYKSNSFLTEIANHEFR